jgi:hypothetical protein
MATFKLSYLSKRSVAFIAIGLIAIVGVYLLVTSHAQSPSTSVEAESGTLSGGATQQTNSSASGGSDVQFCTAPTTYPSPQVGGMTYTNWTFDQSDINEITASIDVNNNPGTSSSLWLQSYDANIDNTGQYFGLQTSGLALFSQFGTTNDADNIELGTGSTAVYGTNEGPFISLRHNFGSMPVGQYTEEVIRTNYDGTGDWFAYYVTMPGQAQTYIGSIRFPRASASVPASFHDGGGSWTEFFDIVSGNTTLTPVPLWNVDIGVTANGSDAPVHAVSTYSTMPDSNISVVKVGGQVNFVLGGSTPRCNAAGQLW